MALAAENAVKQAETAVIVGYSVSFIDAENTNHLIFHTQTGKVLGRNFPERIFPRANHRERRAYLEISGTVTANI